MVEDQIDKMETDNVQASQAGAPAQPQLNPLSLALLSTIKTAQAQNGLRHGDYTRYR